jgi:K+-transporting ATPase A subunit
VTACVRACVTGPIADVTGILGRALGPLERLFYRLSSVQADEEMTWKRYAAALLPALVPMPAEVLRAA